MKLIKNNLWIFLSLLLSFIAIIPFFHKGFFTFHDNIQVQRVFEMTKALADGMFPVRWSLDLGYGYGYPLFNFYAPFAYYIGSVFNILGFDSLIATKIMIALAIVLSGLSMFAFVKEMFGKKAAFLASIFYVFAPYHALDIYVRGDVAEVWAYVFIPLVFYAIYKQFKSQNAINIIIGALAYAGLILSHNLTALMVTPFILIFTIVLSFLKKEKKSSILLFTPLILGTILSAFYWIPVFMEMGFTNVISQVGGGAEYKDHFVCLYQLWTSPWGFGGSAPGCIDGLSFMIGKIHLIFAFISLIIFFIGLKLRKVNREDIILFSFFVVSFFVSVFFTLDYSKFIWQALHPMAFFQYPWRFLIIASFFISVIAASSIYFLEILFKKVEFIWFFVLIVLISISIIIFNQKFFVPQELINVNNNDYTNKVALSWSASEISSEYMPKGFQKPTIISKLADFNSLSTNNISIKVIQRKTQETELEINVVKKGSYIFPIAFFPSWKAYLDSREISLSENTKGVELNLPTGVHILKFVYRQTIVELVSDLISFAGILIIIIVIIKNRIKK